MRLVSKIRVPVSGGQVNKEEQMLDKLQQVASPATKLCSLAAQTQIIIFSIICPRNSPKLHLLPLLLLLLLNLSMFAVASEQQQQQYEYLKPAQQQYQVPPEAIQWTGEEYGASYVVANDRNGDRSGNRNGNGNVYSENIEQEQQRQQVAPRADNPNNNRLPWFDAPQRASSRQLGAIQVDDLAAQYDRPINEAGHFAGRNAARLPRQPSLGLELGLNVDGKQKDDFGALSTPPPTTIMTTTTTTSTTSTPSLLKLAGSETFKSDKASSSNEPNMSAQAATSNASDNDLDSRLAQFINHISVTPIEGESDQLKRSKAVADDIGKVYRVLKFVSKVADWKLGLQTREGGSGANLPTLMRSWSENDETREPLALTSAAVSGISDSVGRRSGKMIFGRLAKKTDWNALFVKLAKVFLQYFLDLILNDMFGTTGKF